MFKKRSTLNIELKNMSLNNKRAAIFDMDGVLIVNMHVHELAFYEFGKRHGIEITHDFFYNKICGNTNQRIMPMIFGEISEEETERLSSEKEAIYRELYTPQLQLAKGLASFLDKLAAQQIPMAIASNAPVQNVEFVVNALGLQKYFQVQLHVTSVARPKPAPDMFLKAAELMGIKPANCVVFEDAPSGIRAAKEAGMKAVALLTTHTKDEFANVDRFIDHFEELDFETI
jgi:beta-phosphoglucomutase